MYVFSICSTVVSHKTRDRDSNLITFFADMRPFGIFRYSRPAVWFSLWFGNLIDGKCFQKSLDWNWWKQIFFHKNDHFKWAELLLMIYCQLGMIEPFRVLQNSDFRLLTCASGTFTMFAKFFKRLMQVIFKLQRLMQVISNWAENYVAVLEEHYSWRLIFEDELFNIGNSA